MLYGKQLPVPLNKTTFNRFPTIHLMDMWWSICLKKCPQHLKVLRVVKESI